MIARHGRVVVVLAAACAVGPDFHRPPPPRAGHYTNGAAVGETAAADGVSQVVRPGAELAAAWWQLFRSPALDGLVTEALAQNPNLEAARASLRRSRYLLAAGYGVFYPQVDLHAGAARQRFVPAQFGSPNPPSEFNLYTLEGTLGYTLDVFGGERRNVEALRAQVDVQCFSLAAARLSVTGNVLDTAIAHAGYRAEITATEELIASLRQQVQIAEAQVKAGTAAESSLLSLRGQLASTAATLPPLHLRLAQTDDLLATLLGYSPAAWRPPDLALADLVLPRDLPVSLPSELVRQRPDILVAEAALHVASANVGVATAAMFPSITLDATSGFTSTTPGKLFSAASWLWSLGANLTAPLFHGGQLNNQRKAAIAAYEQSLASYGQTVLAALADVANALWALALDADAVAAQTHAVEAWAESKRLVEINYASGLADYLQVLVIEDSYLQAKLAHIQARTQRLQDTVALFIALGGGWWAKARAVCT